jgi:transposase
MCRGRRCVWGRSLLGTRTSKCGHTVHLMAGQLVSPYCRGGKNDANDAEAICEAVGRPNMRFVPIKDVDQQAVLMLHRARSLMVASRTAQVNQIRGLLGKFGLVVPQGVNKLRGRLPEILEDALERFGRSSHRVSGVAKVYEQRVAS